MPTSFFNLLWALAVIVAAAIAYVSQIMNKTARDAKRKFRLSVMGAAPASLAHKRAAAWHDVAKLMASESAQDWKIAVLEADSILDGLLEDLGYKGESLGERLKNASGGTIQSLEAAWRAHKVRNAIAHDTLTARLPRREAEETIADFERVFREFDYI